MSTISSCKANLTKAFTALEGIKGKIPQCLIEPSQDLTQPMYTQDLLEQRQEAIQSHLSHVRTALRTVRERQQAFLTFVSNSLNPQDNEVYESYMLETKLEDAIVNAEVLLRTLQSNLDDTRAQLEKLDNPAPVLEQDISCLAQVAQDHSSALHTHDRKSPSQRARSSDQCLAQLSPPMEDIVTTPCGPEPAHSSRPTLQLSKLVLEPFYGDITQFQRFWSAFELAVHNDNTITTTYKFLYLQSLLKGDAQIVLQDLDPEECNYYQLVQALKKRYDRPHKTRAKLHKLLQDLPPARNSGTELRNTWFRISGILHGLRKFEDFRTVLPILDLVRGKFPSEIQQKLHDLEFQSGADFDLYQIMHHLDNIIASREKYEDSTTLTHPHLTDLTAAHSLSRSRAPQAKPTCLFCDSDLHDTYECRFDMPTVARRQIVRAYKLCWKCFDSEHESRDCRRRSCRYCQRDHHELLCENRARKVRNTHMSLKDHSRKGQERRNHDRYRYRSTSRDRYPSRSPSQTRSSYPSRSPLRYSANYGYSFDRSYSRSPSGGRYHSREKYSPHRRSSYPHNRVAFKSPVRDSSTLFEGRRSSSRSGSPYPTTTHYVTDEEFEQVNQLYSSMVHQQGIAMLEQASLMLVEAKTYNKNTKQMEKLVLLLDSGAQRSFITSSTALRLGLSTTENKPRTYVSFGGHNTTEVCGIVKITLVDSLNKEFVAHLTTKDVITLPQHTTQLSEEDIQFISERGLELPACSSSKPVLPDILIGIDNYWDVLSPTPPICLPSETTNTCADNSDDENTIRRLWTLDSLGILDDQDPGAQDKLDENILRRFHETSQIINGYLYVQFPWKESHPKLENNKQLAYCRLVSQYQKLSQLPLWADYIKAIEEHLLAGFIEEVDEYSYDDHRVYYIPHQAVYKESSSTTKLRVVFDASSKQKGAPSLNDCLYQGPTLLPQLVGILLRARLHRFLLIADVEKAFHQVRLQRSQRDATRFLWLKNPHKPPSAHNLRIFRFTRIPFGVNASPFMLAAAIQFYLQQDGSPLSKEFEENTYVDNVTLGAASHEEAITKYQRAKALFTHMHMNLRKFACNSIVANSSMAAKDRASDIKHITLFGIEWNISSDTLSLPIKTSLHEVNSKRTALRALASTYDPLGLLTPFLSPFKVFIQDLWNKGLSWDAPLTDAESQRWKNLLLNVQHPLPALPRRSFFSSRTSGAFELCVFGDASARVYACCAYLVCRSSTTSSRLVMAKSHLNEVKPLTVPRAELLASLISIRMARYLLEHLKLPFTAIHLFSDSQVALYWIHSNKAYKTFVQNRINTIRALLKTFKEQGIPTKFYYVSSPDNPADCATRGLSTRDAQDHIWWTGPPFLLQPPSMWADMHSDFSTPPDGAESFESEAVQAINTVEQGAFRSVLPFHVTNRYVKLISITAYILRFLHIKVFRHVSTQHQQRLRDTFPWIAHTSPEGNFTATDRTTAEALLILAHYRESEHHLQVLPLARFNAQRSNDGLIHCPFRIGPHATAPILLVPSHRLTYIITMHYHIRQYHSGVYSTIATLRKTYFIPSIRSVVTKFLRSCTTCRRANTQAYRYPEMPDLPEERITRSRPFQNVGIDYLGYLGYRNAYSSFNKIWVCLITCMATRAVHLEPIFNNTVEEFLLAFRRFVARRGTPDLIYSDNSSTFRAAENALQHVLYTHASITAIQEHFAKHKITWRFITPLSPWKGGFYERMVALFKSAFKKAIGRTILTLEELQTVIVEIEAVINSRPITPYREGSSFIHVLKPIDFISPEVQLQLPAHMEEPYEHVVGSHKLAEWYADSLQVLDNFWDQWHSDYLAALKERHQLRIRQPRYAIVPPRLHEIVIVADDKLPRGHWPLGIITKIIHGRDGCARSAEVRMSPSKTVVRSLSHLYPLEISASSDTHSATSSIPSCPLRTQPRRAAKDAHAFIKHRGVNYLQ